MQQTAYYPDGVINSKMQSRKELIRFLKFYLATVSTWLLILFFVIVPFDFKFDGFEEALLETIVYVISYSSVLQGLVFYFIDRKYAPGDRFIGFPQIMVFGFFYNLFVIIVLEILIHVVKHSWIAYFVTPLIALFFEFFILLAWPRIFKRFYPDHFINL